MATKKQQPTTTPQPSKILLDIDPNNGTSEIRVVADRPEDRDAALDALRRMMPNIELLESSARPESVCLRLDDGSWFLRYDEGLTTARFYPQAQALAPVLATEVVKLLTVHGYKVDGVFRTQKEDFAVDIETVWK